jgi:hypothetical protein
MFLFDAQKPTNNVKTLLIFFKIISRCWVNTINLNDDTQQAPLETLTLSAAVRLREQLDAEYAEEDRMWLGVEIGPGKTQSITWAPNRFFRDFCDQHEKMAVYEKGRAEITS